MTRVIKIGRENMIAGDSNRYVPDMQACMQVFCPRSAGFIQNDR